MCALLVLWLLLCVIVLGVVLTVSLFCLLLVLVAVVWFAVAVVTADVCSC